MVLFLGIKAMQRSRDAPIDHTFAWQNLGEHAEDIAGLSREGLSKC